MSRVQTTYPELRISYLKKSMILSVAMCFTFKLFLYSCLEDSWPYQGTSLPNMMNLFIHRLNTQILATQVIVQSFFNWVIFSTYHSNPRKTTMSSLHEMSPFGVEVFRSLGPISLELIIYVYDRCVKYNNELLFLRKMWCDKLVNMSW